MKQTNESQFEHPTESSHSSQRADSRQKSTATKQQRTKKIRKLVAALTKKMAYRLLWRRKKDHHLAAAPLPLSSVQASDVALVSADAADALTPAPHSAAETSLPSSSSLVVLPSSPVVTRKEGEEEEEAAHTAVTVAGSGTLNPTQKAGSEDHKVALEQLFVMPIPSQKQGNKKLPKLSNNNINTNANDEDHSNATVSTAAACPSSLLPPLLCSASTCPSTAESTAAAIASSSVLEALEAKERAVLVLEQELTHKWVLTNCFSGRKFQQLLQEQGISKSDLISASIGKAIIMEVEEEVHHHQNNNNINTRAPVVRLLADGQADTNPHRHSSSSSSVATRIPSNCQHTQACLVEALLLNPPHQHNNNSISNNNTTCPSNDYESVAAPLALASSSARGSSRDLLRKGSSSSRRVDSIRRRRRTSSRSFSASAGDVEAEEAVVEAIVQFLTEEESQRQLLEDQEANAFALLAFVDFYDAHSLYHAADYAPTPPTTYITTPSAAPLTEGEHEEANGAHCCSEENTTPCSPSFVASGSGASAVVALSTRMRVHANLSDLENRVGAGDGGNDSDGGASRSAIVGQTNGTVNYSQYRVPTPLSPQIDLITSPSSLDPAAGGSSKSKTKRTRGTAQQRDDEGERRRRLAIINSGLCIVWISEFEQRKEIYMTQRSEWRELLTAQSPFSSFFSRRAGQYEAAEGMLRRFADFSSTLLTQHRGILASYKRESIISLDRLISKQKAELVLFVARWGPQLIQRERRERARVICYFHPFFFPFSGPHRTADLSVWFKQWMALGQRRIFLKNARATVTAKAGELRFDLARRYWGKWQVALAEDSKLSSLHVIRMAAEDRIRLRYLDLLRMIVNKSRVRREQRRRALVMRSNTLTELTSRYLSMWKRFFLMTPTRAGLARMTFTNENALRRRYLLEYFVAFVKAQRQKRAAAAAEEERKIVRLAIKNNALVQRRYYNDWLEWAEPFISARAFERRQAEQEEEEELMRIVRKEMAAERGEAETEEDPSSSSSSSAMIADGNKKDSDEGETRKVVDGVECDPNGTIGSLGDVNMNLPETEKSRGSSKERDRNVSNLIAFSALEREEDNDSGSSAQKKAHQGAEVGSAKNADGYRIAFADQQEHQNSNNNGDVSDNDHNEEGIDSNGQAGNRKDDMPTQSSWKNRDTLLANNSNNAGIGPESLSEPLATDSLIHVAGRRVGSSPTPSPVRTLGGVLAEENGRGGRLGGARSAQPLFITVRRRRQLELERRRAELAFATDEKGVH